MKQLGAIVAGLAAIVLLDIVLALLGPRVIRADHITGTKTVVSLP